MGKRLQIQEMVVVMTKITTLSVAVVTPSSFFIVAAISPISILTHHPLCDWVWSLKVGDMQSHTVLQTNSNKKYTLQNSVPNDALPMIVVIDATLHPIHLGLEYG